MLGIAGTLIMIAAVVAYYYFWAAVIFGAVLLACLFVVLIIKAIKDNKSLVETAKTAQVFFSLSSERDAKEFADNIQSKGIKKITATLKKKKVLKSKEWATTGTTQANLKQFLFFMHENKKMV